MDQKTVLNTVTDILLPYWSLCREYTEREKQEAKRAFIDALIIVTNSKPPRIHENVFGNGFTMHFMGNLRKIYNHVKTENYLGACHQVSDALDLYWTEDFNDGLKLLLEEINEKEAEQSRRKYNS